MDSSVFFIFALVASGTSFAFLFKCFFSLVERESLQGVSDRMRQGFQAWPA